LENRDDAVIFLLFKPQGKGINFIDWILEDEEIESFGNKLFESKANFKVGCDSCTVCRISQVSEIPERQKIFLDVCEGARQSCYITSDMYLKPCSFVGNEGKISLSKNSIQNIWENNEIFKNFRERIKSDKTKCPYGF
jgi:MoaA/NifB/PqqE/SkfB family radical SAM enzyme